MTWRQQADTTAVLWEYGYDGADQLVRAVKRATDPQATVLQRFAYGYDPAGNRLFEQIDDTVTTWTYDRLNRLQTRQAGGVLRVAGTVNEPATVRIDGRPASVDASGVFVGGMQAVPGTTQFTVSATDASGNNASQNFEIDQFGAPKTFTFDPNGNLTSDGTRTFEWDARNQLIAAVKGNQRWDYSYNGHRRRVGSRASVDGAVELEAQIVWCDMSACEERRGPASTRQLFDAGEHAEGLSVFYTPDHLGSVRSFVDTAGAVKARYDYDPWGRRTVVASSVDSRMGYASYAVDDDSGLTSAMFRQYDPELGRWISEDPAGFIDGFNLYRYTLNSPLRFVDPTGLVKVTALPAKDTPYVYVNSFDELWSSCGVSWWRRSFRAKGCTTGGLYVDCKCVPAVFVCSNLAKGW